MQSERQLPTRLIVVSDADAGVEVQPIECPVVSQVHD